jgi:hypothetical protein
MKYQDIEKRVAKAKSLFDGPYNCSQSVAMSFSDITGMEEKDILRAMSGYRFSYDLPGNDRTGDQGCKFTYRELN